MKSLDVFGIGNALVDMPVRLSEETFNSLKFNRGSVYALRAEEQEKLAERIGLANSPHNHWSGGGSASNSIYTVASLSGRAGFSGRVADDQYGRFFRRDFARHAVEFPNPPVTGGPTGTVITMITPDGERTMSACLGVARDFCRSDLHKAGIQSAQWLLVEGYLLANGPECTAAVHQAVSHAKAPHRTNRTKVVLSLSDEGLVKSYRDDLMNLVDKADLVIGNRGEAAALTNQDSLLAAFERLKDMVPNVVVTAGPRGAFIRYDGSEIYVPATPAHPIDTTGAGDTFAGAFLYGITNGYSLKEAARGAGYLATQVIQQHGARLTKGVREAWEEGVAAAHRRVAWPGE